MNASRRALASSAMFMLLPLFALIHFIEESFVVEFF